MLVRQDAPHVERFEKFDDIWATSEYTGLAATLELASLGVTLSLVDIYDGVAFPSADA